MENKARGTIEMTTAMTISGSIGWFVVRSGQPVLDVVFWRSVFGAATLLLVCAMMGLFRRALTIRHLLIAALGGVAIDTGVNLQAKDAVGTKADVDACGLLEAA